MHKYFSERKWAEAFLRGELLFRSLAYFRDYEDNNVREDQHEGRAIFRPDAGLLVNNVTQGTTSILPGHAFESAVKQDEVFVFCLSRSHRQEHRERFKAVACVEIQKIGMFCDRVEAALPTSAKFPGPPGRRRIGRQVEYYHETEGGSPRWALPDVIATSKFQTYSWQDEFRLVFSLTDALEFEKVSLTISANTSKPPSNIAEHHSYPVNVGCLHDICAEV